MSPYDTVLRDHVALVTRAADFAARRHANQRRKGSAREPYVNHLAEVASLLADTVSEPNAWLIAAGWLHDTIEDTGTTHAELADLFGPVVADLVAEVTDDKSLPKAERKRLQVERAAHKSPDAKAIKIADKISNLRSLVASPPHDWDRARLLDYVTWAESVVARCRGTNAALDSIFDQSAVAARRAV
ncbi:HD domain-containing protein [Methylobacterium sp. 174MFSha1.1]|uniref:HD domain-containing protein n=1 Tax=Methylobacterium sp. 174MFSha1.1 TaxID=1502749 RepID=UPI0008F18FE8|nr:HD domain-containing protein [Methylobacterium sp. 174MFSha1.1]SFV08204.1 HD domain-containing protein [Methylobacterium sp. 174MFSha1.1]